MREYNGKKYIEKDKHDINELVEIVDIFLYIFCRYILS